MGNLIEAKGEDRVKEAWQAAMRHNFRNRAQLWGLPEWRIEQIIRETERGPRWRS